MRSPKRRVASDWIYIVSRDKNAKTGEKNYQMKTGRLFEPDLSTPGEYWNLLGLPGDRISTPIGVFEYATRPGFFGWTPVSDHTKEDYTLPNDNRTSYYPTRRSGKSPRG